MCTQHGKPIGKHAAGFAYSSALSSHGGDWDFANMDAWLTSPRNFANGTKMSFAGLGNPEDRANVIAYLNSMGSNLPLPEVEAAPAEEAGEIDAVDEPTTVSTEASDASAGTYPEVAADTDTTAPVGE